MEPKVATSGWSAITHEDLRHGRINIYKLTGNEAADLLTEYDAVVAERDRLRGLLEPCTPDTDAQTDASYPETVNDVLHLLSSYMADFLCDVIDDEFFGAWERQARPVIERLVAERDRLRLREMDRGPV